MVIRKYGLELREVEIEDIEMIRQHRNSDVIRNKMIYRKTISREEQLKWFKEVKGLKHSYYLIYKNDVAIGLINGRNIDHGKKTSEGGIFIWDKDSSYETSILASIILNDWNFFFNDFNLNYAQVLKSNQQAISYNKFMGYRVADRIHENPDVIWMEQSKEAYIRFRKKFTSLKLVSFDITEQLTSDDLSIEEREVEYKKTFIAKLPEKQRKMYQSLLDRR
ncbi:MAG: hypothetical protein JKY48_11495 [Flavobacteriales bacterium]|nr:hypothetical protein [Flavobacteriales bacterium]